jgi:hypothetical protein
MASTPSFEGCVFLSTVTTFASCGGYVGTNEGDSLLVLAVVQGPQMPADRLDAFLHESTYADVYVMNYRLHESGWIQQQKLSLCKLPQWDLGLAIATDGTLMVQLILRDSLDRNMLADAWRQYEWPTGLTFHKQEKAIRNGTPTAMHMSLSQRCVPCDGSKWGADDLELFAHRLALVFQECGGLRIDFNVLFRHDVCWLMSSRAVVCAAFNVRLMESVSADMSGQVPEGMCSCSVRFNQEGFNYIVILVHQPLFKELFAKRSELNQALHQFEAL